MIIEPFELFFKQTRSESVTAQLKDGRRKGRRAEVVTKDTFISVTKGKDKQNTTKANRVEAGGRDNESRLLVVAVEEVYTGATTLPYQPSPKICKSLHSTFNSLISTNVSSLNIVSHGISIGTKK